MTLREMTKQTETAPAATTGPKPRFTLLNSTTVPMTPELAKQFATMTPSPTERPLDTKRLRYLRAKIEAGLAVSFQWAFAKYTDSTGLETIYRMNAQHSSTMLWQLMQEGRWPEGSMWAHIDEFAVNSLQALALLFRQYDDRKSSRSPSDVAGAYQGLYPELNDVPRNIGKLGIEAVTWFNKTVENLTGIPAGDDQYSRFSDQRLWPYLHWLTTISPKDELGHTSLVSAMFATYGIAQPEAEAFWEAVANGGAAEPDSNDPATALYNWLAADRADQLNAAIKPAGYYQGAIYCWNQFRLGKPVNTVRFEPVRGGFYKIAE